MMVRLGYAIGALRAGAAADVIGLAAAMWLVAGITLVSGIVAAARKDETVSALGRVVVSTR
jgi:hypothetical protein